GQRCSVWRYVAGVGVFFFFQAEDGIRDWSVTGVQTCALPICTAPAGGASLIAPLVAASERAPARGPCSGLWRMIAATAARWWGKIGRASCRERVESWGVAVSLERERGGGRVSG